MTTRVIPYTGKLVDHTHEADDGDPTTFLAGDGEFRVPSGGGGSLPDGNYGDVTVSGGGTAITVNNGAIGLAKLAAIAAATILGSIAGGTPAALTGTQVTAILDTFTSVLKGLVPASGGGVVNFLRADGTFAVPVDTVGTSGWYGTGVDGPVVIGAGTTTLTRDMDYTTLVVQNGGILITDLYKITASVSATVDAGGVVHQDGNVGGTPTGGLAGGTAGHTYGRGGNGGGGGVAAGTAGGAAAEQPKNLPLAGATSGQGAAGGAGNGGAQAGGAAGAPTVTVAIGSPLTLPDLIRGCYPQSQATRWAGGSGGGGGGGTGAAAGAGGGGGGGVVVIASPSIVNNGTIRAKGGAGGNAVNNNSGGGGGGGGGKVFLICRTFAGAAPDVSGGGPGNGLGTGAAGGTGQTGYAYTFTGA